MESKKKENSSVKKTMININETTLNKLKILKTKDLKNYDSVISQLLEKEKEKEIKEKDKDMKNIINRYN